jgi:hypothetical protein
MDDSRTDQIDALQEALDAGDLRAMSDGLVDLVASDLARAAETGEPITPHQAETVQRMVERIEQRHQVERMNAIYRGENPAPEPDQN